MIPCRETFHFCLLSVGIASLNATAKFGLSPVGDRVVRWELSVFSQRVAVGALGRAPAGLVGDFRVVRECSGYVVRV